MFDKRYYDESLRPPPESGDGDGKVDSWDWGEALIDSAAYMIEEHNHTSARCAFVDNNKKKEEELQVTFRLAPPPHISYFCIGYTNGEPTEFDKEPNIVAMEGNLALFTLMHDSTDPSKCNYLIYCAPIHGDEKPILKRIPHPSPELFLPRRTRCFLHPREVGILRYSTRRGCERGPFTPPTPSLTLAPATSFTPPTPSLTLAPATSFTPPTPSLTLAPATALAGRHKSNFSSDDCDAYKIASLYRRFDSAASKYDLYIYDSKVDAWTHKPTAFLQPQPEDSPMHLSDRVITIGGTMGWVDLLSSIILCDVHVPGEEKENPNPRLLRYVPLPEPRKTDNDLPLRQTASFFRDIVVVQGRIKLIDVQIHASPGSLIPNGWSAVTWSMALGDSGFSEDSMLHSRDMDDSLEPSLFVGHPTLSSHDDGILYLMTMVDLDGDESRVIAVNMKTKKLAGVAKFTAQREACMHFAYMRTNISNYLIPGADPKRIMKKRGLAVHGSSRKKPHPAINFMSKQPSGYGGDQLVEDDKKNLHPMGDDGDNMDLE